MGKRSCVIGIDPGLTGALAVYEPSTKRIVTVWQLPTFKAYKNRNTRTHIDIAKFARDFADACAEYDVIKVAIEQVHSSPQMGVASAFKFGEGYGAVCAAITLLGPANIEYVHPVSWKARMIPRKGSWLPKSDGPDKKASVLAARERFGASPWFTKETCHGLADAALIAVYAAPEEKEIDPLS